MTIPDYVAIGVLIVVAMRARQSGVKQTEENPKQ
jgi:hypothetical protein